MCNYTVQGNEFDPTTYGDNCPGTTVSNSHNGLATLDGAVFNKGPETVVWTARDAFGNETKCSFVVTIEDNEFPVIITKTVISTVAKAVAAYAVNKAAGDQNAIAGLFENEGNPIEVIKWKELYEHLETAIDKCEDAANIIEQVVLKNA